ncbi:MAG: hypothetical protein ACE37D_21930 [Pseudomonadales bacterium]
MNSRIDSQRRESSLKMDHEPWLLADHVVGKSLFFSKTHLQAIASLVHALQGNKPCCLLRCINPALLDYYTKIIARQLIEDSAFVDDMRIEVDRVTASGDDSFLDTVSQLIEGISLDQALSLTESSVARRCLMISQAEKLGPENEEALHYLIRDFPATNLAYLFTTSQPVNKSTGFLPLFRPSLLELQLESPDKEALTRIRSAVQHSRKGAAIEKLMQRLFSDYRTTR